MHLAPGEKRGPLEGKTMQKPTVRRSRTAISGLLAVVMAVALAGGTAAATDVGHSIAEGSGSSGIARPTEARLVQPGLRPVRSDSSPARMLEADPNLTQSAGSTSDSPATLGRTWQGINDSAAWPTAPSGAVGTTRYVEAVNSTTGTGYAVYDRTHDQPIVKGSLFDLTSCADSNCYNVSPSVIWDPTSNRFFYSAEELPPAPGQVGHIMFGFSKTASPSGSSSWCHYQFGVGANLPDRPQLGDSRDFVIIGDNLYDGSTEHFLGARILAFAKPGSSPLNSCPGNVKGGSSGRLHNAAGHDVFAPAPANEIDSDATGWVVARNQTVPSTTLALFQVTRAASGNPVFHLTATSVAVPPYRTPTDAPQKGVRYKLDTGFVGAMHPVAAIDGLRGKKDRVWVSQTTAGGGGSIVRWFEIDPVAHRTVQSGSVSYPKLWAFNGAISPDRLNNGSKQKYGANMVISYDTSSASTLPTVYLKTKIGKGPVSKGIKVVTSSAADTGVDCRGTGNVCGWGGGAATPDPGASMKRKTGTVWSVQMLAGSGADEYTSSGISWIFADTP
jgi:hypothetical protein